ncbi:MAG: ATP-binding cassette domain-containing protein [Alphaproteobacteria bacterium]
MIAFENVRRIYAENGQEHVVLDDISFKVEAGEFVTLFGPNGCGKSTLMNLLTGIDRPSGGVIGGAAALKGQIGFVFQDYRRALLPWRSAAENIMLPLELRGMKRAARQAKLKGLVRRLHPDFDLEQPIYTLSGGQAQMVGLMRALIIEPKILILDEPFSALDYARTLALRQTIMQAAKEFDLTVLFISHDLEEALYLGDRVVFFTKKPTRVAEILDVNFARPRHPDLIGSPDFAALKLKALHVFEGCAGVYL